MDIVKDDPGVCMNYTAAGDHEPAADCNNLMFKDHIRSIFHSLPFIIIPKIMVIKITAIKNKCLNWSP